MKQLFIALLISLSFCFTAIASDSDISTEPVEQIDYNEMTTAPDFDVLKEEERSYTDSGCAIHAVSDQDHFTAIGSGPGDAIALLHYEVGWRSLLA